MGSFRTKVRTISLVATLSGILAGLVPLWALIQEMTVWEASNWDIPQGVVELVVLAPWISLVCIVASFIMAWTLFRGKPLHWLGAAVMGGEFGSALFASILCARRNSVRDHWGPENWFADLESTLWVWVAAHILLGFGVFLFASKQKDAN